jgi:hypothetical protein
MSTGEFWCQGVSVWKRIWAEGYYLFDFTIALAQYQLCRTEKYNIIGLSGNEFRRNI